MGQGSFPVDLILFGMIAAFLVLRLRSILGRRDGFEPTAPRPVLRPANGPVIEGHAEPQATPGRPVPEADTPLGQTLSAMRRVESGFDPAHFLAGAEAAFRLIVTEFAAGHRDALRPLLTPETFAIFDGAINSREQAGETQTTEIRAIQDVKIEDAQLHGTVAEIVVLFVSDQVSQTLDRTGKVVAGADAVTELHDLWTFTRDLARTDPAWKLAQARSA